MRLHQLLENREPLNEVKVGDKTKYEGSPAVITHVDKKRQAVKAEVLSGKKKGQIVSFNFDELDESVKIGESVKVLDNMSQLPKGAEKKLKSMAQVLKDAQRMDMELTHIVKNKQGKKVVAAVVSNSDGSYKMVYVNNNGVAPLRSAVDEGDDIINEGKTVAVKWYDEFDSGHVVHIGDNTLSLNGAEVNKNFQWDRPKGAAFSTAESYVSEWMYKMAKDWNDVHAYLKRARDTGNEQTLLTAVQKTFDTASMQPKIVEGSMVNGKNMDGEKRWKQTSLSPEQAIAKYGKENVRVKKGALRNGDDMVSVLAEETKALTEAEFDEAAGEKDACYHKVKSRYKVWPSAYASGALVKCRKVGAKNWGNSKK